MNRRWIISIVMISFILLTALKSHETATMKPFFKATRILKLKNFEDAKKQAKPEDKELIKLWESILTGRSAPLGQWMKERYKRLGLSHLFTPSGFHISAVLFPFMKFLTKTKHQLMLIIGLGVIVFFLPGLYALKRMLSIKAHQRILGKHLGFSVAMLIDIFIGSFQEGALSFTYSFLFVGIIYSGLRGFPLVIWFFIAQMILALFQGNQISLILLIASPLLNFIFGLILPLLFLLAIPLWNWQVSIGIFLLKYAQFTVDICAHAASFVPSFEVHIGILFIVALILYKKWKRIIIMSIFLSMSLNPSTERTPGLPPNEFYPNGPILRTQYNEKNVTVVFSDGSCRLKLVQGFWWETCSPRRESKRNKTMKLSYPSSSSQKSSLRG